MTDVTITSRGRSGSATHNKEIAMSDLAETADVVVAGGGSAGAVLAARLSKDPARTVCRLRPATRMPPTRTRPPCWARTRSRTRITTGAIPLATRTRYRRSPPRADAPRQRRRLHPLERV